MIQDTGRAPKLFETNETTSGGDHAPNGVLDTMGFEFMEWRYTINIRHRARRAPGECF